MMIRPMFFIDDWPVFGPEPFTGESLETVPACEAEGRWEIITLDDRDNDQKLPLELDLVSDSSYLKNGRLYRCWDFENQKYTIAVTGFDDSGVAYWGKFMYINV